MQKKVIIDPRTESWRPTVIVWHCLNCGEIVDHVILQNRKIRPQPHYGKVRLKNRYALGTGKAKIPIDTP